MAQQEEAGSQQILLYLHAKAAEYQQIVDVVHWGPLQGAQKYGLDSSAVRVVACHVQLGLLFEGIERSASCMGLESGNVKVH